MSITDELRKEARGFGRYVYTAPQADCLTAIANRIDAEMVELPKDADGVPIRVGDVVEWCDSGDTLTVEGIGKDIVFYIDNGGAEWTAARNKRHHKPTVEDVLREFAYGLGVPVADSYVAAAATKLRLAGGVDE